MIDPSTSASATLFKQQLFLKNYNLCRNERDLINGSLSENEVKNLILKRMVPYKKKFCV